MIQNYDFNFNPNVYGVCDVYDVFYFLNLLIILIIIIILNLFIIFIIYHFILSSIVINLYR